MTTPDIADLAERVAESERQKMARALFDADHPWVSNKALGSYNGWDSHTKRDASPDAAQRRYLALADVALTTAPRDAGERLRQIAGIVGTSPDDHSRLADDKIDRIRALATVKP